MSAVPATSAWRFPAQVDHGSARQVLAAAQSAQSGAERVYDLSDCERFDSSLIAVLLEILREAQAAGATARFEGCGERLAKLVGLYGVEQLLFGEDS
ncbi:MAG: STAS domain-containing protein [Burkholderiaceae bacterium]